MDSREFNRLMQYSQRNHDLGGVLLTVYDNYLPHPYFDPTNITLSQLYWYEYDRWSERKNNTMIWQDIEYLDPAQCPVDIQPQDRVVSGSIYYDTSWPCPSAFSSWHFHKVVVVNKELELAQPEYRPYFADILLGNPKPMRDIFYELLHNNALLNTCLVNLFGVHQSDFLVQGTSDIDEWFCTNSVTTDEFKGHFASQYISKHIYENTWVSVVAESQHSNDFFFPTEKTGKALFGKRPFIVLSGQHYLRTLRSLGFRTFDSVIDESYDEIADYIERTQAAFRSFTDLMSLDQQQVRQQLHDVLEHNHQLICDKSELNKDVQSMLGLLATAV